MPDYKLIYFNVRGRAELCRWIMHYADIPFTDERVEKEDWPEKKKTIQGGKLPVLEVDGKVLPESHSIARFVALKAGLMPKDPLDAAFCDAVVELIRDVIGQMFIIKMAEDKTEEAKEKALKEFIPNSLEPLLDRLNKHFEKKEEWYISNKITWADLAISCYMEMFPEVPEMAVKFPKLKAHVDKIRNLPKIKEWIQRRPETPM